VTQIVGVPCEAYPCDGRPVEWQAIDTPDHGKGLAPSVLRSPHDEHVCFAKFGDRWRITDFGR
jgi:hypothetical protein